MEPLHEELSGKQLARELKKIGVPDETLAILEDEEIDGSSFFELSDNDLQSMKIKMGPRKIILKLIRKKKEQVPKVITDFVVQSDGSNEYKDRPADFKTSGRSDIQQGNSFLSINTIDNSPRNIETIIEENINIPSTSNSNKVPPHVFSRYGTVKDTLLNHIQGKRLVISVNTSFNEEDRRSLMRLLVSELVTVHGYYPPEKAKIALAKAIITEFPVLKDNHAKKGYEHYYDEQTRRGFIEFRLWTIRRKLSPSMKKYKRKSVELHNMKNIEKCLLDTLPNRRDWIIKERPSISDIFKEYPRLLDCHGQMIENEFECLFKDKGDNFPHVFSRYGTVKDTLLNHIQGKGLVISVNTSFTEEDRRSLMRVLVSELVTVHGYYPPEKAKISLAKAIITEFPVLKDNHAKKGYEHYYDEQTRRGFIEFRLWTIRKKLSPSMKKYKRKSDELHKDNTYSNELLSKEKLDPMISWMKFKNPSESNMKDIEKCLLDTLPNRRDWIIKERPSISDIFKEYPRLLDYHGQMIKNEFECLFKDKSDNFLSKFPEYYCPRILEYAKLSHLDVYDGSKHITDENLRALAVLADLLPTNNAVQNCRKQFIEENRGKGKGRGKKRRRDADEVHQMDEERFDDPSNFFIRFLPEGTNTSNEYVKQETVEAKKNVQPYIVCVKGQNNMNSYFVQGDGWFITTHDNNLVTAFDLLFKTYFVLNVCYPVGLQNFYNFIETYVYNLGTSPRARGVVASLHVNLCNVKIDNVSNDDFD